MTRLNNRKAYYQAYDAIEAPERLGVIFADINGLKYTNDNFGHAAGDKLIVDFARMLSEHFRGREIFRISGDEFVVLCQDISEKMFDTRVNELIAELRSQSEPIATIGAAHGLVSQSETLRVAERHMYEQKAAYYEKHPDRKR